jgi:hypothetical protein
MCSHELGGIAPSGERALLEKYLTHVEQRIDKLNRPAYKMSPALRIAAARAAKEQGILIGVGGW